MHYYKRNLGDYAKKAGRLSMLQHGSYTLLIDACYDREQFPTLEDAIEWTWASSQAEIEAVEFILKKFFTLDGGVYIQKRIKEEIEEYHDKAETNKRIAIEREANRKEREANRERTVHEPSPQDNEPPPNHKPITNNQEPRTKNQEPRKNKYTPPIDGGLLADFLVIRKAKRLGAMTETAFKGIEREAVKAGLTPEQAITVCCERGWGGFKADWLTADPPRNDKLSAVREMMRGAL